jgi:WD40 repeat protein/serine/threonine protein kinase
MNQPSQADDRRCSKCGTRLDSHSAGDVCLSCALENAVDVAQASVPAGSGGIPAAGPNSGKGCPENSQTGMSVLQRFGDYELLEEIARGGMGVVFKARQSSLDRLVAIKMLLFGSLAGAEEVQRFRTEAAAAASLQHPNIVAIHEVGFRDGQYFIAMDYVEGRSLAEIVQPGPLPPRRAATYVKNIGEAIQYAHERGILHRDLKPSNVLIDEHDQPKVTDFGLAKRLEKDSELTLSGQVMGSPSYMAPEQAAAHRGLVGKRSDVYSLGAVLYHLLTGRPPFVAATVAETLQQVQNTEPVSPTVLNPHLPRDLKTICLKCLEKAPARRYQSAQELADELGRWLRGEPIQARPVSRPEKLWRWCRRKPVIATLSASTLLLLLAVAIGSPIALFYINKHRHNAEQLAGDLRRSLYAAQMNQAFRAWDVGNLDVARALLNAQRPPPGTEDLRGADWRWLWELCRSEAQAEIPTQGELMVTAAEPSPDGRRVATAGSSTNIIIYDLAGKTEPQTLRGHTRGLMGLHSLAFSPDGRHLASVSGGALQFNGPFELLLWDLATGSATKLEERPTSYLAVAYSPNGRWLASACLDGTVGLWDAQTHSNLAMLHGHQGQVYSAVFAPDSQTLFTGGEDGTVRRWDVSNFREILPRIESTQPFGNLALSPDGRTLAIESVDHHLHLRDLASGKTQKLRYTQAEHGPLAPVFSPDGRLLVFGTGNNIRIWDMETGLEKRVLRGSTGNIMSLRFLPDGQHLVSACEFGRPLLWNINRPDKLQTLRGFSQGIKSIAVSSDSRWVAVGSADFFEPARPSEVIVFDLASQKPLMPPLEHPQGVTSLTLPADGRFLVTGCWDGSARVFSMPEGRLLRTLTNALSRNGGNLVLSPDGRSLVTCGGTPRQMAVWDTLSWEAKPLLNQIQGGPMGFAFSPDGSLLATPFNWWSTIIWNMPAGATNTVIRFNQSRGSAFSADGSMLAIYGFFDIELFQAKTWKHLGTLKGHEHVVNQVAFAPDGKTLASAGIEGALRLWSVPGGEAITALYDHLNSVEAVAFTPDGRWLISGSRDKIVKLRRIPSFEEIDTTERSEQAATARERALRARGLPD